MPRGVVLLCQDDINTSSFRHGPTSGTQILKDQQTEQIIHQPEWHWEPSIPNTLDLGTTPKTAIRTTA